MISETQRRCRRPMGEIAALSFLLLFWLYRCFEILTHFFSRLYLSGAEIDMVGQLWMSWWAHQALTTPGLSPFFCPYLNYPLGVETFTYHVAFVHVMASGLLRPVLGMVGSINAMFVYGTLLSLLGMYVLLRQLTENRFSAALFATLPVLHAMGATRFIDIEQVNFGYLTLALAAWLALVRRGGKGLLAGAGILIGLTCITQMYYGISFFLIVGLAIIAGRWGLVPADQPFRVFFRRTLAALAIGIPIGIIPLLPSALTIARISVYEPIPLFINSPSPEAEFLHLFHLSPIPVLAAVILLTARKNRQAWFWFGAMTCFLLLAAGTHMRIGECQVPMPFWFLRQAIPLFWRLSMPVRFGRIAILLLAAVSVLIHSRLHLRLGEGKQRQLAAAALYVAATFFAPMMLGAHLSDLSFIKPIPTEEPQQTPEFFRQLGQEKTNTAAFSLRCEIDAQLSAYYQIFHHLPISGMPLVAPNLRNRFPSSELTRLQDRFCQALDNHEPLPGLPDRTWWTERNIGYLFLASSFIEAAGPEFLSSWETTYGKARFRYQHVHVYDLQSP